MDMNWEMVENRADLGSSWGARPCVKMLTSFCCQPRLQNFSWEMVKSQITLSRIFNQDERTVHLCRWKQACLWWCFVSFFLLLLPLPCFSCAFTAAWWSPRPWFWSSWPRALLIWKRAHLATVHCPHGCCYEPACTWSCGFSWIRQRVHPVDRVRKPTFSLWDEEAWGNIFGFSRRY